MLWLTNRVISFLVGEMRHITSYIQITKIRNVYAWRISSVLHLRAYEDSKALKDTLPNQTTTVGWILLNQLGRLLIKWKDDASVRWVVRNTIDSPWLWAVSGFASKVGALMLDTESSFLVSDYHLELSGPR